jgi:TatD DNase family protein
LNLTDTHCHLYLKQFHDDTEEVLNRSADAGVVHIFLPAIDWESIKQMYKLTHPQVMFYKMAGIHPCSVEENLPLNREKLFELCNSNEFVGVGETGLDYYWSTDSVHEQKKSLRLHCDIARQTGKPVVLHNRDSTTDLLDIIEEEQDGRLTGVWHCFTGTVDEGKRAIDLGLYLGVGGVVTFKNAGIDSIIKQLPSDRLLLETDSPYLTPAPYRGKRNEPSYIKIIALKLAEVFETTTEEIAKITTNNAFGLFGLAQNNTTIQRD